MTAAAWKHWYRRAFPAYWIFVFCATHFPGLEIGGGVPASDKVAHTAAFALLAFLFWRFLETFRRPLPPRAVWIMAAILTAYSALDEYTQQFVGRGTDPVDWLCNVGGMGATLVLLEWRRRTAP